MIFVVEQRNTDKLPKEKMPLKLAIVQEANYIYRGLYLLDESTIRQIDEVFLLVKGEFDKQSVSDSLQCYSADIEEHKVSNKLIGTIEATFPDIEELVDTAKRDFIESLIKTAKVCVDNVELCSSDLTASNDNLLFYLPYSNDLTFRLMKSLPIGRVKLFSNQEYLNGRGSRKVIFLNYEEYDQIKSRVEDMKKALPDKADSNEVRHFRLREFLECLGSDNYERVLELKTAEKRRLNIFGDDPYVTRAAIDEILKRKDRVYYELPEKLGFIENKNSSVVAYNFDSLENPADHKKLYERVEKIGQEYYVILQAIRNVNSRYFTYYDNVKLPGVEELKDEYTRIFLAMLCDRGLYKGNPRDLAVLKGNILYDLIPKIHSFRQIDQALDHIKEVKLEDLRSNSGFWYYLNHLTADIKDEFKPKTGRVIFNHTDSGWEIFGLGDIINIDKEDKAGVIHACIIIRHYQLYRTRIPASKIREIYFRYTGKADKLVERRKIVNKKLAELEMQENDRKRIRSSFKELVYKENRNAEVSYGPIPEELTGLRELKEFIDKHINCIKSEYFFNPLDVEVEIHDPLLKDTYFK